MVELINLYVIAHYVQVPRLQNKIMHMINDDVAENYSIPTEVFRFVYQNTREESTPAIALRSPRQLHAPDQAFRRHPS